MKQGILPKINISREQTHVMKMTYRKKIILSSLTRHNAVGIATVLRAGRSRVRIPIWGIQIFHTGFGTHSPFHLVGTGVLSGK